MQLLGAVQLDNAETAVAAALQLRRDGFPKLTDEAIAAGLASATLPGRFQVVIPALSAVSSSPHTFADMLRRKGAALSAGASSSSECAGYSVQSWRTALSLQVKWDDDSSSKNNFHADPVVGDQLSTGGGSALGGARWSAYPSVCSGPGLNPKGSLPERACGVCGGHCR